MTTRSAMRMLVAMVVGVLGVLVAPIAVPAQGPADDPVDDQAETCPPLGVRGEAAVVRLAYVEVLGRCPDASGYLGWVDALEAGLPVARFARLVATSAEARGVLVDDAYRTVLGRPADAGGRTFWVDRLGSKARDGYRSLLADLAASREFWAAAGSTNAGYVEAVYQAILDRPAEPSGRAYWVARLDAGESRRSLVGVLTRLTEPLGVVVSQTYGAILDRGPTAPERTFGVARLRGDGDRAAFTAALVATPEFASRAERVLGFGDPPSPPPPPPTDGAYVALGDSYASGEGNAPYDAGTDDPDGDPPNTCHRSDAAYARVAAAQSPAVPDDVELAACSGATIPDFYRSGEDNPGEPPQLDALGGTPPELVSVAIGGNDIGFRAILTACLQVVVGTSQLNPDYSEEACNAQLDEIAPAKIAELATGIRDDEGQVLTCGDGPCTLSNLFDDIAADAPGAEVAVVGYPPPLPAVTSGDCTGQVRFDDGSDFPGAEWVLAEQYVDRLRGLFTDLNAALEAAADEAGFAYVDSVDGFAGHAVCSDDPFIYGLRIERGVLEADSASFHPTAAGHRVLARSLAAVVEA